MRQEKIFQILETKKFLTIIFLGILFISNSFTSKQPTEKDFTRHFMSNLCKVNENYFCDRYEIRNIDYCEYLYWLGKVFGVTSATYKGAEINIDSCLTKVPCESNQFSYFDFNKNDLNDYLHSIMTRYYPVIGITQQQAEEYTKWRSDRVFEYFLILNHAIDKHPEQDSTNYFTIEKYFKGKYYNYKPDSNIKFFPEFRLPSQDEWLRIKLFSDSIDNHFSNSHPKYKCKDCKTYFRDFHIDITPCDHSSLYVPTVTVYSFKKTSPIQNLTGNVSEWTSDKNICMGGGWKDTKEQLQKSEVFITNRANVWTGFRNVCQWKKWDYR